MPDAVGHGPDGGDQKQVSHKKARVAQGGEQPGAGTTRSGRVGHEEEVGAQQGVDRAEERSAGDARGERKPETAWAWCVVPADQDAQRAREHQRMLDKSAGRGQAPGGAVVGPAGKEQRCQAARYAPAEEQVGQASAQARGGGEGVAQRDQLAEVADVQGPEERLEHAERHVPQVLGDKDGHGRAGHGQQLVAPGGGGAAGGLRQTQVASDQSCYQGGAQHE